MNRLFNRRVGISVTAVGIALMAGSSSADHSWGNYHWDKVTLAVGDNVDAKWDGHLNQAIGDWNKSELTLSVVDGGTRPKNCRPTAGRLEVCNATYGANGWLGIAQIWASGGHITQAVTKLNDTYFNTPTYNTDAWRQLVTCQEIAHDFGLDHQDENFNNPNLGSCMDYTSDPDGPPSNEHPNQHDYDQITIIYDHVLNAADVESGKSPNPAPSAMNQIDFENRGQWGKLVRSSRNGRVQLFELDFGKGHKVITHVFWANPEEDSKHNR